MPKRNQIISGKAWRFGANISTDDIISGVHLGQPSIKELLPFVFEHLRPDFAKKVKPADIIVADKNFGIGSSREEAPAILHSLELGAIVAASFARIFFRNAYNIGLPAIEFPAIATDPNLIQDGDSLEIRLEEGTLLNQRTGQTHEITKVSPFLLQHLRAGGAIPLLKKKLKSRK